MEEESDQFARTRLLYGDEKMRRLFEARVAVFGIGGVGGYVVEALARSGVGSFLLVDKDDVSLTNLNRQIIATHKSLGRPKVQVMKERVLDINPAAQVDAREAFYLPENSCDFDFSQYSYVVDAVDTVTAKLEIITQAKKCGVPVISSMGAGNKTDPTKFLVADIYQTSVCPLARVMRRECKSRGIKDLKVVYSTEAPAKSASPNAPGMSTERAAPDPAVGGGAKKIAPASVAFVPSVAGLIIAAEVVRDLVEGAGK